MDEYTQIMTEIDRTERGLLIDLSYKLGPTLKQLDDIKRPGVWLDKLNQGNDQT